MQQLPGRLLLIGLICLLSTIALFWVAIPGAIRWQLSQMIRFEEGNQVYNEFTNIKAKILFSVYIYNVTNAEDVASGKSLPKLDEIGPYVYEEKRNNIPVKLDPENDTFTYQSLIHFTFRPDLSAGSDEDYITMLNVPIVAISHELKGMSRLMRSMAQEYIESYDMPLFVRRKVRTALFDGVHLELVETVSNLLGVEYMPNSTFAYFYHLNATLSRPFVVNAGLKDTSKIGSIITFDGKKAVDVWPGESCNAINGSDGSLYPPFVTRDSVLHGFNADICRSVSLVYKKDDEMEGIPGYRFGFPDNFLDSGAEENQCFCGEEDRSKCPKKGTLSIAPCKFGAPLLMSNPHFSGGDPYYREITGLSEANPEMHETYAIIEPTTGIVLKAGARLQLNIEMTKSKDIKELKKVKDTIFPLFWVDEVAVHPQKTYDDIKWKMSIPLKVMEIVKWGSFVASTLAIITGAMIFMLRTRDKKKLEYY